MIKLLNDFQVHECGILDGKKFIVTGRSLRGMELLAEDGERTIWSSDLESPSAESIGIGGVSVVTTITWPIRELPGGALSQDPPTAWERIVGDD